MKPPVGKPLGVGIIGAGAATQAIHLPTLASLRDRLRVTHVVGKDAATASAAAARAGPRGGTSVEALLDDPAVDLVAVCSPHALHAAHAIAACAAGKGGVLVEKPLALTREDATRVGDAATRFGVPVVVGAMHRWDPAWQAASSQWLEAGGDTRLIRSTIHVPVNDVILQSVARSGQTCDKTRRASPAPPGLTDRGPAEPRASTRSRLLGDAAPRWHPATRRARDPAGTSAGSWLRGRRLCSTHVPLGIRSRV